MFPTGAVSFGFCFVSQSVNTSSSVPTGASIVTVLVDDPVAFANVTGPAVAAFGFTSTTTDSADGEMNFGVRLPVVCAAAIACCGQWIVNVAFAVFDQVTGSLFLARDQFGIKPLHYIARKDGVVFCSELKGIVSALGPELTADPVRPRDKIAHDVDDARPLEKQDICISAEDCEYSSVNGHLYTPPRMTKGLKPI